MTEFFAWVSIGYYLLTTPVLIVDFPTKESCIAFARVADQHARATVTCFERASGLIVYDTRGRTSAAAGAEPP